MPIASASSSSFAPTLRGSRRVATQKKKTNGAPKPPASNKRPAPTTASHRPPPEKRQARFIPRPTTAVSDRIDRAFHHRLYLIDTRRPSHFFVLGATANVYTVRLDLRPSCTCPDFQRGNTCKHILFVMLRVLKLPIHDPRVWQKALLSTELNELLSISSINETVLANHRVRARFQEIAGSEECKSSVQRKLEGDCPVCYEPLGEGGEAVVFCAVCGNNVHEDCFVRWRSSKRSGTVTCIYCRAAWGDRDKKAKHGDYVNLAAYSDSHGPEDTSLEALYPETSMWIQRR